MDSVQLFRYASNYSGIGKVTFFFVSLPILLSVPYDEYRRICFFKYNLPHFVPQFIGFHNRVFVLRSLVIVVVVVVLVGTPSSLHLPKEQTYSCFKRMPALSNKLVGFH